MRHLKLISILQGRKRRDYIFIRRIMLIISILGLTSIPISINLIKGHLLDTVIYGMQWLVCSLYGFIIVISMGTIKKTSEIRTMYC